MQGVGTPSLIVDQAGSPHTYSLKPSQAAELQNADVVFWVGHDLETFLEKPLETVAADAKIVELIDTKGLKKLDFREGGAFDSHDHGDHADHGHEEAKAEHAGHDHDDHGHKEAKAEHAGHDHDDHGHGHEEHAGKDHDHDHDHDGDGHDHGDHSHSHDDDHGHKEAKAEHAGHDHDDHGHGHEEHAGKDHDHDHDHDGHGHDHGDHSHSHDDGHGHKEAKAEHAGHDHDDHGHGHEEHAGKDHDHDHDHDGHGHDHGDHSHSHDDGHGHKEAKAEHAGHDHDDHAHHGSDPHVWLDPVNAKLMVEKIEATLVKADPANASAYEKNADALVARIGELETKVAADLAGVKDQGFIVFHDAYHYFEDRFGLTASGSITVSPERVPGAQRVSELRERVNQPGIACVFSEPQFEPRIVATIAEGTSVKTGVLDPLGAEIGNGAELYFTLIENMATSFKTCLAPQS
ncbi:MAG: zinc ABC transporter substrate-binding protein [Pseudomonadota bacterium]